MTPVTSFRTTEATPIESLARAGASSNPGPAKRTSRPRRHRVQQLNTIDSPLGLFRNSIVFDGAP